ncbi:DUF4435 domain-containing protein [Bacillus sp. AFS029533]|uniref:DUF4435 domain-containing protein n=1 Tax=Bacillus sp. AFS029533 TaxID=2033494 RepID=UPI0015D4F5F7|nr:DUF4435 domain-containing protein [Bacillus sp. AFS029533]
MNAPQKNPNRIVSEFQVKRNSNKGKTIVLVEGAGDIEFFQKIFCVKQCRYIDCNGKDNVKDSIRLLNNRSQNGFAGIVDCDFDKILGRVPLIKNLYLTDTHDIETMIMSSGVTLNDYIKMYADLDDYEKFLERTDTTIDKIIINSARIIGLLRYISIKNNFNLSFKEIDYTKFLDANLEVNLSNLCKHIIDCSFSEIDNDYLEILFENEKKSEYNDYEICSGHDITEILHYGMKFIFGSIKGKKISRDMIEERLRLIYDYKDFFETKISTELIEWENINHPYFLFEKPSDAKELSLVSTTISK